ncbi:hypothetical protein B0H94_10372 [Salsuginibacillus halophilus]|uniref:Uncharacterized protein n=1 Tax=Salsuginibacillus halophilus TaxID=517424 RepID=A0A2P8HW44_9BACI|nr:hypothetical protein [Salsuginibacillus halophilus]PSL50461.1 hypothetical protein B0H94_10372 [Salsuginibacillus halophilus]
MHTKKLKHQSLVRDEELGTHYQWGLPVEVYCLQTFQSKAFGRPQAYSALHITIQGKCYPRRNILLFGCVR